MLPGGLGQAVVERQVRDIEAEVRCALYVGVAAEDVGARARLADIAGGEAGDAEGADIGCADRLLRRAHAPDYRRRLLVGEEVGDPLQLFARHPGDALDFLGRPLGDFLADIVHAVDALGDEVLVLPAVLEDVPEHAPDERDVGAAAEAHIFGGVRRRPREARIHHHHVGAVDLLAGEDVLHRDRMRLGGVGADEHHRLGVADVVVGVGLRAVAPDIGDAGDCGRVTDARLVVDRIGAPERGELAHQIGGFVGELRRSEPVDGIGAGLLAHRHHLVADFLDRLLPGDPLPLPADHLHRVF
jgi:hypothetical protein